MKLGIITDIHSNIIALNEVLKEFEKIKVGKIICCGDIIGIGPYPEEVILKEENNYSYQIASKEKALCDKLYTLKPLNNYSNLEKMLFDDLRIDREEFNKLNIDKIEKLSNLYHSTNVKLLAKYMRRNTHE